MSDIKNLKTIEEILDWFKSSIDHDEIILPSYWVEAALKLLVLMGAQSDRLYEMQQTVANQRKYLLERPNSKVGAVKMIIEASNEYRDAKKQEALVERIVEFIRLAKLQARLRQTEMGMNN